MFQTKPKHFGTKDHNDNQNKHKNRMKTGEKEWHTQKLNRKVKTEKHNQQLLQPLRYQPTLMKSEKERKRKKSTTLVYWDCWMLWLVCRYDFGVSKAYGNILIYLTNHKTNSLAYGPCMYTCHMCIYTRLRAQILIFHHHHIWDRRNLLGFFFCLYMCNALSFIDEILMLTVVFSNSWYFEHRKFHYFL